MVSVKLYCTRSPNVLYSPGTIWYVLSGVCVIYQSPKWLDALMCFILSVHVSIDSPYKDHEMPLYDLVWWGCNTWVELQKERCISILYVYSINAK